MFVPVSCNRLWRTLRAIAVCSLIPALLLCGEETTADPRGPSSVSAGPGAAANQRGLQTFQSGDFVSALRDFEKAIQENPQEAEYYNNAGVCLLRMGQYPRAEGRFREAISRQRNALYQVNLGLALQGQQRFDDAIASYRKAMDLDERLYDAPNQIALIEYSRKNFEEAEEAWQKASEIRDNAEVQNNIGMTYLQRGQLEDAILRFTRAMRLDPRYQLAPFNLGVALQQKEEWAKAEEAYRLALKIDANAAPVYMNLAIVQTRQNKRADAIASLNKFIELAPPSMAAQVTDARRRLAELQNSR